MHYIRDLPFTEINTQNCKKNHLVFRILYLPDILRLHWCHSITVAIFPKQSWVAVAWRMKTKICRTILATLQSQQGIQFLKNFFSLPRANKWASVLVRLRLVISGEPMIPPPSMVNSFRPVIGEQAWSEQSADYVGNNCWWKMLFECKYYWNKKTKKVNHF